MKPSFEYRPHPLDSNTGLTDEGEAGELVVKLHDHSSRRKLSYWRRMGGGSLLMSLTIHTAFVAVAIFLVQFMVNRPDSETPPDILSGGGGGGKSSMERPAEKRRVMSLRKPASRMVSISANAVVTLPDTPFAGTGMALTRLAVMGGGGTGGGEGGLRGSGIGGTIGSQIGRGTGPGTQPGFVAMFGRTLKARRLAVVLDVSSSMHPFLATVVKEANKVSGGCPVVLFFGCGVQGSEEGNSSRLLSHPARGRDFREFWQRTFGQSGGAPDRTNPLPEEGLFKVFDGRKDTHYFERTSVGSAWQALVSPKLREADAIYWFADFRDPVDEAQLLEVRKVLANRKQKLYVHASGTSNPSLHQVYSLLVEPTGGEVLKVEIEPVTNGK